MVVAPVAGAPGDGQRSLTTALKKRLYAGGVKLANGTATGVDEAAEGVGTSAAPRTMALGGGHGGKTRERGASPQPPGTALAS